MAGHDRAHTHKGEHVKPLLQTEAALSALTLMMAWTQDKNMK